MKTKRIVALALTAAMAVSMASMTAFAANWSDFAVDSASDDPTEMIKVTDNGSYAEYYEGFVVKYQVQKTGSADMNDTKNYVYRKGSTIEESTSNGKTTKLYILNDGDSTQTGAEEAGVLWKNFKSKAQDLGTPSLEEEDNCVFLGWTLKSADAGNSGDEATWKPSTTKAGDVCLGDNDDIIAKASDLSVDIGDASGDLKIYPVFRAKTAAEKLQSQVNIANRPKVAKPVGDKEWVYSQKDLDRSTAKVSAPLAEDASGDALRKCNAEMKHSRVYEIKPQVTDPATGEKVLVELKKGAVEEVKIPVKTLYPDADVNTAGKINDLINKGKLKVYHIGSDGKSRQVTGIKGNDNGEVVFKCGSFSEFVITKDPNAKAQAGEEDGASGGNPATGEASTLPVAMLALAALSATGIVAYKKRKAE